jgi:hypothetical protein
MRVWAVDSSAALVTTTIKKTSVREYTGAYHIHANVDTFTVVVDSVVTSELAATTLWQTGATKGLLRLSHFLYSAAPIAAKIAFDQKYLMDQMPEVETDYGHWNKFSKLGNLFSPDGCSGAGPLTFAELMAVVKAGGLTEFSSWAQFDGKTFGSVLASMVPGAASVFAAVGSAVEFSNEVKTGLGCTHPLRRLAAQASRTRGLLFGIGLGKKIVPKVPATAPFWSGFGSSVPDVPATAAAWVCP